VKKFASSTGEYSADEMADYGVRAKVCHVRICCVEGVDRATGRKRVDQHSAAEHRMYLRRLVVEGYGSASVQDFPAGGAARG